MKKFLYLLPLLGLLFFACSPDDSSETGQKNLGPVEVGSFLHQKADLGDTVSLRGKNFPRSIEVYLSGKALPKIFNNDTLIQFQVPYTGFDPFDFYVRLGKGADVYETETFQLHTPTIDSIPAFSFTERVTLYGKHLSNLPGLTRGIISLNGEDIPVISQSRDSIVFQLPYLNKHENELVVKAQLQAFKVPFKVPSPQIDSISRTEVRIGDTLRIYGKHFYPYDRSNLKVFLDGIHANVYETREDSLLVQIPGGPYEDRHIEKVEVRLFEEAASKDIDLQLVEPWYLQSFIPIKKITAQSFSGTLTPYSFADKGKYIINSYSTSGYELQNNLLYEYDPATGNLEALPTIPIELYQGWNDFHFYPLYDGQHVFIYLNRKQDNFFKYNYRTQELTPMADFTDAQLHMPTGVFLNGDFYFGMGFEFLTELKLYNSLWRYDRKTDSWTDRSEKPTEESESAPYERTAFIWKDRLYLGNGGGSQFDFWEFSPGGTWTQKSSLKNPASESRFFQVGNKGYFYNMHSRHFWEYDMATDVWTSRQDLALGKYSFSQEDIFILGDHIYFVGSQQGHGEEGNGIFSGDHLFLRTEISNLDK